jgi:hypothetical protein
MYSGSAFIAFAMVFIVGGLRLGVASPTADGVPGSGFFPVVIGGMVALLGVVLIIQSLLFKGEKTSSFRMVAEQKKNIRSLVHTVGGLAGMFAVWHIINFEVAMSAFSLFINRMYGRGWRFCLVFTFVFVGLIYVMFDKVFHIQFTL